MFGVATRRRNHAPSTFAPRAGRSARRLRGNASVRHAPHRQAALRDVSFFSVDIENRKAKTRAQPLRCGRLPGLPGRPKNTMNDMRRLFCARNRTRIDLHISESPPRSISESTKCPLSETFYTEDRRATLGADARESRLSKRRWLSAVVRSIRGAAHPPAPTSRGRTEPAIQVRWRENVPMGSPRSRFPKPPSAWITRKKNQMNEV